MISQPDTFPMVFMSIGLGGLGDLDPHSIGCVYEFMSEAGARAVNGMPSFFSCKFMHIDDWKRVKPIIQRLDNELKNIELPPA